MAGMIAIGLAMAALMLSIVDNREAPGAVQVGTGVTPAATAPATTATATVPLPTATPTPNTVRTAAAYARATAAALQTAGAIRRATAAAVAHTATAAVALAPTLQAGQIDATARYAPEIDRLLLRNGYTENIISVGGRRGLRASQLNYSNSFWTRDLDYAISGYSYVLGDMSLFAENIELFLSYVTEDGIAPETIYVRGSQLEGENRQSWDSMPNLIHAVYVYVAKTGDRTFYWTHRDTLLRVGGWIARLDTDDDGLPDQDIFPYGYFDSVVNGPLHTYALAKFYTAYLELAELEEALGQDGAPWRERASRLRAGFHRPLVEGGYWQDDQPWPIAWKRADGQVVTVLETFGVFAALRGGLIAPADARYPALVAALHDNLPALLDGPAPLKLTLGGYPPEARRVVDPPVPLWMLDASAPWVVGLAAPAYAAAGYPDDARAVLDAYTRMAQATTPPVVEFTAGPGARYGPGDTNDRGRTWDSAAWFMAVYGGHYGLTMTPAALVVHPHPLRDISDDQVIDLSYQGALVTLQLDRATASYRLHSDRPIVAVLMPMGDGLRVSVDGAPPQAQQRLLLEPLRTYVVTNE